MSPVASPSPFSPRIKLRRSDQCLAQRVIADAADQPCLRLGPRQGTCSRVRAHSRCPWRVQYADNRHSRSVSALNIVVCVRLTHSSFPLPSWQMPNDEYGQNIALLSSLSFPEPRTLNSEDTRSALCVSVQGPPISLSYSHQPGAGSIPLPEPGPSAYFPVSPVSQEGHNRIDDPLTYYPDDIAAPIDPRLFSFPHDGAAEGAFASRYLHSSSQPPRIGHSSM